MTEHEVRQLVRDRAALFARNKGSTGLTAWCVEAGVAKSHASEFLRGKRAPASDLLEALGLEYAIVQKRVCVRDAPALRAALSKATNND